MPNNSAGTDNGDSKPEVNKTTIRVEDPEQRVAMSYNKYWGIRKDAFAENDFPEGADSVSTTETENGKIISIPVMGSYFSPTEYRLHLLFIDKKARGVQIEKAGYDVNKISPETVNKEKTVIVDGQTEIVFDEKTYFQLYENCMDSYPNFNVLAIGCSVMWWYYTGNTGEGTDLVFYNFSDGTLAKHSMVGKASTIAQAREEIKRVLDFRYDLGDQMIIFPFTETKMIKNFDGVLKQAALESQKCDYLKYNEFSFAVPVRNEKMSEKCYLLLLTHQDRIYGEVIIKIENDDSVDENSVFHSLKIVYENIGEATSDGYRALDTIGYIEFLKENPGQTVCFDGKAFFAG